MSSMPDISRKCRRDPNGVIRFSAKALYTMVRNRISLVLQSPDRFGSLLQLIKMSCNASKFPRTLRVTLA